MRSLYKTLLDSNSVLHKCMSYGLTFLLLLGVIFLTPGKDHLPEGIGTLLIVYILYYTLLTKRILETLIFATMLGIALNTGVGVVDGFKEQLYTTMSNQDFLWIVLMCCFLNVFTKLLGKTGALHAFARLVKRKVKSARQLNMATWLMQFPLFFDDYMTVTIGGGIMAPMYDELDAPREDGAYLIHTLAEPLRVLFPITSWAAFLGGVFASAGLAENGNGMMAFFRSIPFSFYAIVSLIGTFLFAAGYLPRLGGLKTQQKEYYVPIENMEEQVPGKKDGGLLDFFLPIVFLMGVVCYFEFDTVPAMLVVLPVTVGYYLLRNIIQSEDIEECLIAGFADFMSLIILFCVSYMLNDVLVNLGYIDYLANVVQTFVNPNLLPFLVFVVFCISECIMSLNWGLILITFPILIPVSLTVGANPYLVGAAIISAGAFGCNMCYICDYTMLTSAVFGLKPGYHASTCVAYSVIFAAISAVMYLIAGFVF